MERIAKRMGMRLKRSNELLALLALLCSVNSGAAMADPLDCWTTQTPGQLIDVDGKGEIQGAWALPSGLLVQRLERAQAPIGLLLPGYDRLSAQRVCADILEIGSSQAKLVFGGRERLLAQQGAPAWDWLMVSIDALAPNLLSGGLQGIFIGQGKAVVGKGLEKSSLTDPGKMAAWLIDNHQARFEPVVLFVAADHQQAFFEFFSNNPLPGVFLSFDDAEAVKDALNKHASFSADEQARLLNYYCN